MKRQRLNEVFPDWATGNGFFSALQSLNVPWRDERISDTLDIEYFGNVAGERIISPLVRALKAGETLTSAEIAKLALVAYNLNIKNWNRQYATLSFDYNPIENYRMEETTDEESETEYGKIETRTDNLSHTKTGTETLTHDTENETTVDIEHAKTGTETLTHNTEDEKTVDLEHAKTGTETTDHDSEITDTPALSQATNVYGFNSSTAVPAGTQVSSGTDTKVTDETNEITFNTTDADSGTETTTHTGTETTTHNTTDADSGTETTTQTGTDTTQYNTTDSDTGTQATRASGSDTVTRNGTVTRSGNIGVTTSQQMIESERNLWLWNFFQNVVFPDVSKVLALPIY